MKARTLSLIGKGIGLVIILVTWGYKLFILHEMSAVEVLAYSGGILGLFVDVAVNIALDKKKEGEITPIVEPGK
jgi:hypothetical protein